MWHIRVRVYTLYARKFFPSTYRFSNGHIYFRNIMYSRQISTTAADAADCRIVLILLLYGFKTNDRFH